MAGLLVNTSRGKFRITDAGKAAITEHPQGVNLRVLREYPGYLQNRAGGGSVARTQSEAEDSQTPDEILDSVDRRLRSALAQELQERLRNCSPDFFEKLVIELLVAMGYGGSRSEAARVVGRPGDGGIDGIIKEDKLGLDAVYVQAKKWTGTVGRPEVQGFAGSLEGERARKGVMITPSQFSAEAHEYVKRIERRIVLIDGERLVQLMIDHDIGVAPARTVVVKRVDTDYFDEE